MRTTNDLRQRAIEMVERERKKLFPCPVRNFLIGAGAGLLLAALLILHYAE